MARPLTKKKKLSGELYTRPPNIEDAIDAALALDQATLVRRASISDRRAAGHLPSECLVHVVRKAHREADEQLRDQLLPPLLSRCEANLKATLSDDRVPNAEYLRGEALGRLGEIFAADGTGENPDVLDYYEVRFNDAFAALRVDLIRAEGKALTPLLEADRHHDDNESLSHDEALSRLSKVVLEAQEAGENILFRKRFIEAVNALPPDERRAVILCHLLGCEEESDDPHKSTAATICGVTGRTIRNRLTRAATKLLHFKENL